MAGTAHQSNQKAAKPCCEALGRGRTNIKQPNPKSTMFTNIRTVSVEPSNVPKTKQPHILRMSDHLNKAIIES